MANTISDNHGAFDDGCILIQLQYLTIHDPHSTSEADIYGMTSAPFSMLLLSIPWLWFLEYRLSGLRRKRFRYTSLRARSRRTIVLLGGLDI